MPWENQKLSQNLQRMIFFLWLINIHVSNQLFFDWEGDFQLNESGSQALLWSSSHSRDSAGYYEFACLNNKVAI